MTFTLCTSGNIVARAGGNADSTIITSGNFLAQMSDEAEGYICEATGTDWVTNYSSVSAEVKNALQAAASAHAAMGVIMYDSTGYQNRELQFLMQLNDGIVENMINKLKDTKYGNNVKAP